MYPWKEVPASAPATPGYIWRPTTMPLALVLRAVALVIDVSYTPFTYSVVTLFAYVAAKNVHRPEGMFVNPVASFPAPQPHTNW